MSGVHFSWDRFPSSLIDESYTGSNSFSFSMSRAPDRLLPSALLSGISCVNMGCKSVLNRHSGVAAGSWTCNVCNTINNLTVSVSDLAAIQGGESVSYENECQVRRVVVFVIDLNDEAGDFKDLVGELMHALLLIPEETSIAIIGFSLSVWFFTSALPQEIPKKGFGLVAHRVQQFLIKKLHAGRVLETLAPVTALQPGEKPHRVTGNAISISLEFADIVRQEIGETAVIDIDVFMSGACNHGKGKMVSAKKKSIFRSYGRIGSFLETYNGSKASDYYKKLGTKQFASSVSVFGASLDECGLFEVQPLCSLTGGSLYLFDTFKGSLFHENLLRHYQLKQSNAELSIVCSSNLKIQGIVGPVLSCKNHSQYASDVKVGQAYTNKWRVGSFGNTTTLSVYLHQVLFKDPYFIQLKLDYISDENRSVSKVVSLVKTCSTSRTELTDGFDQQVYFVNECRRVLASHATDLNIDSELLGTLRKPVERAMLYFGGELSYHDDNKLQEYARQHNLLQLNSKFNELPYLCYFAGKSFLFNKFNTTPDESAYKFHWFNRLPIEAAVLHVKPQLFQFSTTLSAIELDANLLQTCEDKILVLDNFFQILVHIGSTVGAKRDKDDLTSNVLINAAVEAALQLAGRKNPYPRFTITDEAKSQARFLYSTLTPIGNKYDQYGNNLVLTEEESLSDYYHKLSATQQK